jgi:hypothetical protein
MEQEPGRKEDQVKIKTTRIFEMYKNETTKEDIVETIRERIKKEKLSRKDDMNIEMVGNSEGEQHETKVINSEQTSPI